MQLYEDAVEMQKYFIKTRDELCKNGELLLTPALSYTEKHLSFALDLEQKEKSKAEKEQMKEEDEEKIKKEGDETSGDKMVREETFFHLLHIFFYCTSFFMLFLHSTHFWAFNRAAPLPRIRGNSADLKKKKELF